MIETQLKRTKTQQKPQNRQLSMQNEITTTQPEAMELMKKPVWQMSGEELCILAKYATGAQTIPTGMHSGKKIVIGIKELSAYLGCSESTIYSIKKMGILDPAIVSQIGRRIVFDAEKARELADDYQKKHRKQR